VVILVQRQQVSSLTIKEPGIIETFETFEIMETLETFEIIETLETLETSADLISFGHLRGSLPRFTSRHHLLGSSPRFIFNRYR
jgi:hypothetical protein